MELNCILCDSNESIVLHTHRNGGDKIVGMVCLCKNHSDDLLDSTMTINYKLKSEYGASKISKLQYLRRQ